MLTQSLVLLPLAGLALRVVGLGAYQRLIDRLSRGGKRAVDSDDPELRNQIHKTARLVEAAGKYGPYRAKCLPESLTLWWLLRRQGIESRVRLGARKNGRRMEAHAWVEFEGTPLNDSADVEQRFKPFERARMPEEAGS